MTQLHSKRREIVRGVAAGEDCAEILSGDGIITVSSINVCIIDEDTKEQIVLKRTFNDIAVSGAEPSAVLLSLIIPQEMQEAGLRRMIAYADDMCMESGAQIADCDISVSGAVESPVMTVSCIGRKTAETPGKAVPGDDIVVSKWAALSGTVLLVHSHKEKLLKRFSNSFIDTAESFTRLFGVAPEAAVAAKSGAGCMHDASEGGIFNALWEIAEKSGVGLEIDLRSVPLRQETVEICNYLDISPYELMSDGMMAAAVKNGESMVRELKAQDIDAAVIGKVISGNDRCVINEDERRFLEPVKTDSLYKIKYT